MSKKEKPSKDPYENLGCLLKIIPFFLVFIGYGTYGRWYESKYQLKDLVRVEAVIEKALPWEITSTSSRSSKRRAGIELHLRGYDKTFNASTSGLNESNYIIENYLHNGDTAIVYHRHRFQQLIGMGAVRNIYQLETTKYLITDLKESLKSASNVMFLVSIGGGMLFLLWLGYLIFYYAVYRRRGKNKSAAA